VAGPVRRRPEPAAGAVTLAVRLAQPADLPGVFALRHDVFVVGQHVPVELERDEYDEQADHAVAARDGQVLGTGRLVSGRIDEDGRLVPGTAGTVGTIGRMAVADAARGSGVGRALLNLLVARARERGLPAVELHAQLHARGFYELAGFTPFGDVYLEAGIEHVGMRRELVQVP
jgi:predicted GNAT family N-acyltransferase